MDFSKVIEFTKQFETKSAAFLDTLDKLLSAEEANAGLNAFLTAHFPAALTWEKELHAALTLVKNAELRALPEVDAVLAFLATLQPKAA